MPCEPLNRTRYGGHNGFICTSGPRVRPKACFGCGQKRAMLECDAEDPSAASDTCDNPICGHCTSRVVGLDVDLCPMHAKQQTPTGACIVSQGPTKVYPLRGCAGAIVHEHGVCLRHLRLFDTWLAQHGGWKNVYSNPRMSREDKRKKFREWLEVQPAEGN